MRTLGRLLPLGVLPLVLAACDGGTEPSATLMASPDVLVLNDASPTRTLFITTSPSGGRLSWQVAAKPEWLSVTPSSGEVRGMTEVMVSAPGLANAEPGYYPGRLDLVSDGGTVTVGVNVHVSANPTPAVSPEMLHIPEDRDTASFTLRNTGRGTLQWSTVSSRTELRTSPASGTLGSGDSVRVQAIADKEPLPVGEHAASITVTSPGGASAALPVRIVVPAAPVASTSTSRLAFTAGVTSRTFTLRNAGKGSLTWTAAASHPWLSASPASGQVLPGDSVRITASVNRTGLAAEAEATLTIGSNATNGPVAIQTLVTASAGLPDGLRALDHRVIDAEYAAAVDLIVTVSANPSRLNLIDLLTGRTTAVPLGLTPTAVSVQPNGRFAAVGHNGRISHVDLLTRTVTRVYAVTTDVLDVVLAGNGWVYAFPARDQWETVRSVNLATGVESTNSGYIYAGTVAKLHPSGEFLYGANRGLSPSDFEKFDIRSGPAVLMYDSPYHGQHAFSGDIWISEDGARLFARSGNVFRSSPVRSEDMQYAGALAGGGVLGVSDSRRLGRIVAIPAPGFSEPAVSELRSYDQSFMALQGTVALPGFETPGGTIAAAPKFVFAARDGGHVYVLVQAADSGLANDWAIVTLPASEIP